MGFTIFALAFLGIGLVQDYKRDKGQHTRAKIFHAICLTILIASYAGSFKILGMLIRDFDGARERFSIDVGLVPGQIHWMIYLVHSAVVMTVIMLAYQMIRRSDKSRRWLVMLLPLAGLLEVFSFYRGWVLEGIDEDVNHGMIVLIGLVIIGMIVGFVFSVYNSTFMKSFFALGPPTAKVPVQAGEAKDSSASPVE